MKKVIVSLVMLVLISFASTAQTGLDIEARAKRKAEQAAMDCIDATGNGVFLDIYSVASLNLYCDVFTHPNPNYAGYSVQVFLRRECPPGMNCIDIPLEDLLIATVLVDCGGQVYDVQCASGGN